MRIVITEFMDEAAVSSLRSRFDVDYEPSLVDDRRSLLARLAGAQGLIVRNRTQVDADLLGRAPALRVVGRLGVGLDNIDMAACKARGITVFPATGANALAVAEYVVMTAMLLLRGILPASAQVAAGQWPRAAFSNGRETGGKTLGLVGFGDIGRLTASLAAAVGMTVVACDPAVAADSPVWRERKVRALPLPELLAEADVVSLHVPLTAATRGLLGAERIGQMKSGAVLINTSRGGVVDEAALVRALRDGRLAGAALDVFADEPLPQGSVLADAPNLILTPHVGGLTVESNQRVSSMVAERVSRFLGVH